VIDTPGQVAQVLAAYRDWQLTHLSNFHQPGMATAVFRRSVKIFATDIMPAVEGW